MSYECIREIPARSAYTIVQTGKLTEYLMVWQVKDGKVRLVLNGHEWWNTPSQLYEASYALTQLAKAMERVEKQNV